MNRKLSLILVLTLMAFPVAAHNGVDDEPHHGGVVKPYKDMHFEAALVPTGEVQIYFSDATGEPLPATAVSQVAVEIETPGQKTDYVDMAIDPTGVFWVGRNKPVTDPKSMMHVGFLAHGKSALVDVPGTRLLAAEKSRAGLKSIVKTADSHHDH